MGSTPPPRLAVVSRRNLAFVLAIILPIASSAITVHTHWLQAFPLALHFLAIFVIAAVGGFWPALVGCVVTLLSRGFFEHLGYNPGVLSFADRFRSGFLFLTTLIISFVFERRLRSEDRLAAAHRELQERTANLIDSLNSNKCACWTIDLDSGRSARWYRGSYEVFGRSFDDIEQLPSLGPLLHPEDQPRLRQLVEQMRVELGPLVFEHRVLWPNGETHWLEMRGTRISDSPCCWRGVTLDITERRVAEAALIRSEKLAAMGRLASTVAHEINNPLESVTNLLYLALQDTTVNPTTHGYLATAEAELARLGNITRLALGYVRKTHHQTHVDVTAVIDEVLAIFSHRSELKSAHVERDFAPGIRIAIAPHELRQIVTNLVSNATDAVASVSAPRLRIQLVAEANTAVLIISDNGSGIDAADTPHIFEPFFSTKEEVGTGIGLWVTRELVEKNGGAIHLLTASSSADMRTSFRIEFPLAQPQTLNS